MDSEFSDGNTYQVQISKKKPLAARPVSAGSSGEGLPYAPDDWPCPGDKWRWKVGRRMSLGGFWVDRYLYPPDHLLKANVPVSKQSFSSRHLVGQYIHKKFPKADVDAFFDSFIWKIPCRGHHARKDIVRSDSFLAFPKKSHRREHSESERTLGRGDCKAGNKMCSLQLQAKSYSLRAMDCDICCIESGFCRDCCCILCCKTIDWAYGGYSFIRCEVSVDGNFICGHVAHLDCALRACLAGTVRGSVSLDVEYYCRRCDRKTDLISHLTKLICTCESLDSWDDVEKMLNLALCILRGSEQMRAESLHTHINLIKAKLCRDVLMENFGKAEDNIPAVAGCTPHPGNGVTLLGMADVTRYPRSSYVIPSGEKETVVGNSSGLESITSDYSTASVKLEDEIDQVIRELRKSQESEYRIAEQKLYAHKDLLLSLYQQLDVERTELADPISLTSGGDHPTSMAGEGDPGSLLTSVLSRVDQIKHEEAKLRQMMQISKGFGQAPKDTREHFGLLSDD